MLVGLVEKYGPKDWSTIASHIQGRIGKQCRERWFNHLSPEVRKTNWSPEEDRIIIEAHHRLGNKWTAISKLLDGRPANAIKNHWNSTLLKRIQDSNGGMPSIRRERKNTKSKALSLSTSSSFHLQPNMNLPMHINPLNTSTNSLGSYTSEDDDLYDDSDDSEDVLSSSSSMMSSPEQPASPEDSSSVLLQTRMPQPPQFVPMPHHHQQFLHELQLQQLQQLINNNCHPFEGNSWEWAGMPSQQINVHTAGASLPVSLNGGFPVGAFNNDKFATSELMEQLYHAHGMAGQPLQEPPYGYDGGHDHNLNTPLEEEYSPASTAEGPYGMNFLNMEMPGYCPLSLDI